LAALPIWTNNAEVLMPDRKLAHALLVEPDGETATLFIEALHLRAADIEISRVETLRQALGVLNSRACDVALVELKLADAQGLATLARLREAMPTMPIVVLTTIADEDLAITAIQQGAQDYLIKEAVNFAMISRSIRYSIERKRMEVELQAAKAAAQAASAAKSEFLAHMSQEIRNPLTAIVNYAELLLAPEAPAEERHAAIDTIRRNGLHLLEVVNDILDVSKVESRHFEIEPMECSPTQIVAEVLEMFQVRAAAKGLELTVHWKPGVPATIVSDPLRLKQILVNLISNAVKFTERGQVRVEVSAILIGNWSGPALQMIVSDTGIGISEEQRRRLFIGYRQSEAWIARQFGGTGLGLAISRELALKLGGDIRVESALGMGSTFTVSVATVAPQAVNSAVGSALKPTCPINAPQISGRLLLADDAPDNRRLISALLTKSGASVDVVENGQQAIDLALHAVKQQQPYDVVLMDMVMPEKDGFTATRQLREAGYTGGIVALTANEGSEARQECLAAGCDGYATKPVDRDALIGVISRWVKPVVEVAGSAGVETWAT
jgi:signal transduction histidine kinase